MTNDYDTSVEGDGEGRGASESNQPQFLFCSKSVRLCFTLRCLLLLSQSALFFQRRQSFCGGSKHRKALMFHMLNIKREYIQREGSGAPTDEKMLSNNKQGASNITKKRNIITTFHYQFTKIVI